MLVLKRGWRQPIYVDTADGRIIICPLSPDGDRHVRVGIQAPPEVEILRNNLVTDTPAGDDHSTPHYSMGPPTPEEALLAAQYHAVMTWTYTDSGGRPVFVVAAGPAGGRRRLARKVAVHRDTLGWRLGAPSQSRVLYRLPALLAAPPSERVIVCTDEAAADALATAGHLTTTCYGLPRRSDWSPLLGRPITLLAGDDQGLDHRRALDAILRAITADYTTPTSAVASASLSWGSE